MVEASGPEAVRRLQHEISIIERLGFPEYFLVVKDIVDFAKSRGIRYSGGSAGDSIVAHLLGITDADPIAHDLLFERFLNPARRQMPESTSTSTPGEGMRPSPTRRSSSWKRTGARYASASGACST
ncbi:MAG: hypothetical protein ACYC6J_05630 [Coriobacteriia bacterium]